MPLAVDLIAHLTDYEGLSHVVSRWELEKTSMLSVGLDRRSSLDTSINLSLSSPRITAGSRELLSLLSILPNGLSEGEILGANLGIDNILSCKAVLQATSLAYQDSNKRLLLLMPIREYIQSPEEGFVSKVTGRDHTPLINDIQGLLPELSAPQLEISFLREALGSQSTLIFVSPEALALAEGHLEDINDPLLQAKFYLAVGSFLFRNKGNPPEATKFLTQALELSEMCGDIKVQCSILLEIGCLKNLSGLHTAARDLASVARKLAMLSGDLYLEAQANLDESCCSRALGEYQEAAAQLQRARELLLICGMSGGVVDQGITVSQAEIHLFKSEYAQCRSINSKLVKETSPQENSLAHANALLNIAHIDIMIRRGSQEVYHNLHRAREIFKNDTQARYGLSACDTVQAHIELREGKFSTAGVKLEQCLRLSWGTYNDIESFCLAQLANITGWPANEWQYNWPTIYLAFACKSKDKLALHQALLFLGDIFVIHHDEHTTTNLYQVALAGFTQMDVHHSRAQCMLRLGDLANKQGYISEAISFRKAARPLFLRSSQSKDVTEIDLKLATIEQACQRNLMTQGTLNAPVHLVTEQNYEMANSKSVDERARGPIVSITV
ncbi:hypothetical protein K438DRAFT_1775333 [Mycena galopus ATCC 62051]|nr:hypothetical protein K438DRAFT_1775333 [Mycena galopus ATCC 62051]